VSAVYPGYSNGFYAAHQASVRASAEVVVALLGEFGIVPAARVIDIGCGRGDWLSAFGAAGSTRLVGIDGAWNAEAFRDRGEITFCAADLEQLSLDDALPDGAESFDLAMSVEVAEHLSAAAGDQLVAQLVRSAPVVLFSAAIPGQGGTDHRNEQWPSYWAQRFARHGYQAYDLLRPKLWSDSRVSYWYRQNLLLFAKAGSLDAASSIVVNPLLDVVHPELLSARRRTPLSADWAAGSLRLARRQLGRSVHQFRRR
jgi:SAM-dependent methyltransferase